MTEDQIRHMAARFCAWPLPSTFRPDGGIVYQRTTDHDSPRGTNLLTFDEALGMVRHMVADLPPTEGVGRNHHHAVWKAFKNGYACGMDHDGDADGHFEAAAEAAFAVEHPDMHAKLAVDWAKVQDELSARRPEDAALLLGDGTICDHEAVDEWIRERREWWLGGVGRKPSALQEIAIEIRAVVHPGLHGYAYCAALALTWDMAS